MYREEYSRSRESGADPKTSRKTAKTEADKAAKDLSKDIAVDAARSRARSDLESGKAFTENARNDNAQTQADFDAGARGARGKELATELDGRSLADIKKVLDADVQAGKCNPPVSDPLPNPKGPPLPQEVYVYKDGTVVRLKSGGDLINGSDPMYSIEVTRNGVNEPTGPEDIAFKIDNEGTSVPKGPNDAANPYDKGKNPDQWKVWNEEVMKAGHRKTTEPGSP